MRHFEKVNKIAEICNAKELPRDWEMSKEFEKLHRDGDNIYILKDDFGLNVDAFLSLVEKIKKELGCKVRKYRCGTFGNIQAVFYL